MRLVTYIQAWPTPTPIPLTPGPTPFLDTAGMDADVAEYIVQGYQYANNAGLFDLLSWVLLIIILIVGIMSIMQHVRDI